MKVVYKRTVLEQIADAYHKALVEDRKIEKIVLSKDEAKKLEREVSIFSLRPPHPWDWEGINYVYGIHVEIDSK
jgi:hypothetical protein